MFDFIIVAVTEVHLQLLDNNDEQTKPETSQSGQEIILDLISQNVKYIFVVHLFCYQWKV